TDPSIFCYIELPPMIGSSKITWNEHNIIDITNWLTRVLKNDRPLKYNFEQKNKLYFFRKGQTFPMIRLYFKTFAALKHFKNIVTITLQISKNWITNPEIGGIDIEVYTPNHNRFPNELNAKDCAYMISYIHQRSGDIKSRKKFCILMGDCNEIVEAERIIKVK